MGLKFSFSDRVAPYVSTSSELGKLVRELEAAATDGLTEVEGLGVGLELLGDKVRHELPRDVFGEMIGSIGAQMSQQLGTEFGNNIGSFFARYAQAALRPLEFWEANEPNEVKPVADARVTRATEAMMPLLGLSLDGLRDYGARNGMTLTRDTEETGGLWPPRGGEFRGFGFALTGGTAVWVGIDLDSERRLRLELNDDGTITRRFDVHMPEGHASRVWFEETIDRALTVRSQKVVKTDERDHKAIIA